MQARGTWVIDDMALDRKSYKWFYDHIHSHYYNLLIKWCFLPFGGETKCREELLAHVDCSSKDMILDMCCGTGGATYSILKKAGSECEIIGMDLSFGQISIAAKRPGLSNVQLVHGDAACSAFQDQSFDKVFITHALHEMPREIRLKVLSEARRILRNNGTVIVLELDDPESLMVRLFIGFWFFYWLPFNFETPTRRDLLKNGLTKEVKEAGFKNIMRTSTYHGTLQTVQGVK